MEISTVYAITIGGCFGLLLLINSLPLIARLVRYLSPLMSKYLIYRNVLYRHRFLGPWSRAGVLVQLIYIAGNICCLKFWNTTISQAGLRAGTLAVINLMPVFAGPHLSTLADLLGVSLSMFRQIHRSAGVTAVALAIFHVLVMVTSQPSFSLDLPQNLFAVIVGSLLGRVSPLTLYIGGIIARMHNSTLPISLPQTLLRTLPPLPPGPGRALCLLHLATPALGRSLPPHVPLHLGGVVSVHVYCPRGYHHPSQRCLSLQSRASPDHP